MSATDSDTTQVFSFEDGQVMWNGAWIPGAMDMSIANSGDTQVFAPSDDGMELSPPSTPPVAQPPPAVVVVDTANPATFTVVCVCGV